MSCSWEPTFKLHLCDSFQMLILKAVFIFFSIPKKLQFCVFAILSIKLLFGELALSSENKLTVIAYIFIDSSYIDWCWAMLFFLNHTKQEITLCYNVASKKVDSTHFGLCFLFFFF